MANLPSLEQETVRQKMRQIMSPHNANVERYHKFESLSQQSKLPPKPGGHIECQGDQGQHIPQAHEVNRSVYISRQAYPAPSHEYMLSQHYSQNMTVSNSPHIVANTHHNINYKLVKQGTDYNSSLNYNSGGDSKNSSPRTSLINPPPPPYDQQKFGSPRSSLASPRSSISGNSLESKHSSPRTSLAGMSGVMYDKYPSPRTSVVLSQDHSYGHPMYHGVPPQVAHRSVSIVNDSRFNEHAPPHIQGVSISNNSDIMYQSTSGSMANLSTMPNDHHLGQSQTYTPPPAVPARVPIQQNGIQPNHMDAEKTLATLTQQLQDSMQISTSRKNSLESPVPKNPPPPYHGPHKTEPVPVIPPRNPRYQQSSQQKVLVPGVMSQSQGRTPPSAAVRPQAQLPYSVTTSTKGPSEAEKKIAAMTQQLEDELEKTPQGEYFGKFVCFFLINVHVYILHVYLQCRIIALVLHIKKLYACACSLSLSRKR